MKVRHETCKVEGMEPIVMTPETEIQDQGRTFEVLLSRREGVEAALVALSKRAARKGLEAVRWSWGKAHAQKERVPHPEFGWEAEAYAMVSRVPLTIQGDAPHYQGWTFLAALQHLLQSAEEGYQNIVRAVPGSIYDVPERFRTRGPVCDHCQLARRRNDTYVLRHEDGRVVQVGSTCIGDFLGSADASKIAAAASMLAEARGLAEGGCSGAGAGGDRTLAEYLSFVAWAVREEGWVSRTAAREENREGAATANRAFAHMLKGLPRGTAFSAEDVAEAAAAEAWAESLADAEVDAGKGDYLHNLRAVARTGLVTYRTAGIAASMIVAHQRAVARERERAERAARPKVNMHVGTVGKRETFEVVLDFVTGYETQYGYTTVLKFRTAEGACVVWKATNTDLARADVGKRYRVTGTVKAHDEYKGEKQTMVTRCKVEETNG